MISDSERIRWKRSIRDIRPILTKDQLREIGEMVEEAREASELRFADFAEQLAAGELLGLKAAPAAPSPETSQ